MVVIIKVSIPSGVVEDIDWYPNREIANRVFKKLGGTPLQLQAGNFTDEDERLTINIRELN